MSDFSRDYEAGARAYCAARGWDTSTLVPDTTIGRDLEGGFRVRPAIHRTRPLWQQVAEMLREADEHAAAMAAANAAMPTRFVDRLQVAGGVDLDKIAIEDVGVERIGGETDADFRNRILIRLMGLPE